MLVSKSQKLEVRPLFAALKAAVGVFSLGVLKAHTRLLNSFVLAF